MSTTFKVIVDNKNVEIARRNSIGNGKVKITWLNPLAKFLDNKVDVYPIDNTAQGVMYLEDLKVLDKYHSFDNIQQTKDILKSAQVEKSKELQQKVDNIEKELSDYLIHIFKLDKKIKALQGNINALTTAHNMLNEEHRELKEKHNKLGLDVSIKNKNNSK